MEGSHADNYTRAGLQTRDTGKILIQFFASLKAQDGHILPDNNFPGHARADQFVDDPSLFDIAVQAMRAVLRQVESKLCFRVQSCICHAGGNFGKAKRLAEDDPAMPADDFPAVRRFH